MTDNAKSILQSTIRRLTFVSSISISDFALSMIQYETSDRTYRDNDNEYDCSTNNKLRIFRKLTNALRRLSLDNATESKATEDWVKTTKKYDIFLEERKIPLYNRIIPLLNYPLIKERLNCNQLKTILDTEGQFVNYDLLSRYYPYFVYEEEAAGFSFVEFIILFNIYLTAHNRTLDTLCKPVQTSADKKRAEKLISDLCQSIASPDVYHVYTDMFFYVLYDLIHEKYLRCVEDYICIAWLPEKYKKRKNAFLAFEKHGEYQLLNALAEKGFVEQEFAFAKLDMSFEYEQFLQDTIPLAWHVIRNSYGVNGKIKNGFLDTTDIEPDLIASAKELVRVVRAYVRESINIAQEIIKKYAVSFLDNKQKH